MKLGIMQPYFFPYLGYFQLIKSTERWVVFDTPQYTSKTWINRNRILHPAEEKEWRYINIPVRKHKREEKINQIIINDSIRWQRKILGQLTTYKQEAPHYLEVMELVDEVFAYNTNNLSLFLANSLEKTCAWLGIKFEYSILSKMNLELNAVEHPGQWALRISEALRATEYVNAPSGYRLFDKSEFTERNIKLRFLKPKLSSYLQKREAFVPGLSIIDVIMWNSRERVLEMLDDYRLLSMEEIRG